MTSFWRALCLLVLGLALSLGAPLRALAVSPPVAGSAPVELDSASMPCHEVAMANADEAAADAAAASCPHCSHGQAGWGCSHCAGCLLGAVLGLQSPPAAALIEHEAGRWRLNAESGLKPVPARVPTPPPKTLSHR